MSRTLVTGAALAALLLSACAKAPVAAPAPPVDTYAADRAHIEDLQARYLFALDFRDADSYANTFAEDGVLDYGAGQLKGRQAIADFVKATAARMQAAAGNAKGRPTANRHNISNIVIKVDGDKATSVSYWFNYGNTLPDYAPKLNSFGHYEDELVKVDGEWLFALRKIYNENIAEWAASGANPQTTPGTGPKVRATQTAAGG